MERHVGSSGPSAAVPGWALGLGSLAIFLASVSAAVITLALKPMLADLHGDTQDLIWVSTAYLIPFASALPLAGKLADAIGHRKVLLWSLALYMAASAGGAWVGSIGEVIVTRAAAGVGGAGLMISLAWVTTSWAGPRQGFAVGVWRALLLAGTVGGPPLGGLLAAEVGWRSVMWIFAPLALVGLVLAWRFLPEPGRPRGIAGFDWAGATSTLVGLSALVVALTLVGTPTTAHKGVLAGPVTWAMWAVVAASALVTWASLRRAKSPIVDLHLLRIPRFTSAGAGTLLICVGMFSTMYFVPLFLQYHQGYSPLGAAAAVLPVTVLALAVGVFGGMIADKAGPVLPSVVGFVLLGVGFVLLAQITPATSYAFTGAALALTGIGMALPLAPTAVVAVTSVPEGSDGEASGLFNLAHNFGRPLALAAFGIALVVPKASTFGEVFWFSAIAAALGVLASLGLRPGRAPRREARVHSVGVPAK